MAYRAGCTASTALDAPEELFTVGNFGNLFLEIMVKLTFKFKPPSDILVSVSRLSSANVLT